MSLDWLLNPVTFYSGASICLLVSLSLFLNIKIEMARARHAKAESAADPAAARAVEELRAEIAQLRESVERLEADRPVTAIAVSPEQAKRTQVLRLHRRGEAVSNIAAALETPSNEIALMLKLHALHGQGEVKAS